MAKKVAYELMTPSELIAVKTAAPVVYLPLGPLEWHGPHLPVGMDGLHAHHLARLICSNTGGVVFPPLYLGTETVRNSGMGPQSTGTLGLPDGEPVVGMDFPGFDVKSVYIDEGAFGVIVQDIVRKLVADDFRIVVIVNGHGAVNHQRTLRRIAREESAPPVVRVEYFPAWGGIRGMDGEPGHADKFETNVLLALEQEHVRLEALPPKDQPLYYYESGIVDADAFNGNPTVDFSVPPEADPRDSTREAGLRLIDTEVAAGVQFVRALLSELIS